jgi:hypothetical protein
MDPAEREALAVLRSLDPLGTTPLDALRLLTDLVAKLDPGRDVG